MLRTTIYTFVFLLLTSCINKDFYESYGTKVDSLSASLEEMAAKYEALDTLKIKAQLDTIWIQLDSLSKTPEITLDTLVVYYKYIGKDYKTFWRGHPLTIRELNYTRAQLTDLKNDIEKYQLDESAVKKYYIQEKESVRKLKNRMDYNMASIKKNIRQYMASEPKIAHLIDSLYQQPVSE